MGWAVTEKQLTSGWKQDGNHSSFFYHSGSCHVLFINELHKLYIDWSHNMSIHGFTAIY